MNINLAYDVYCPLSFCGSFRWVIGTLFFGAILSFLYNQSLKRSRERLRQRILFTLKQITVDHKLVQDLQLGGTGNWCDYAVKVRESKDILLGSLLINLVMFDKNTPYPVTIFTEERKNSNCAHAVSDRVSYELGWDHLHDELATLWLKDVIFVYVDIIKGNLTSSCVLSPESDALPLVQPVSITEDMQVLYCDILSDLGGLMDSCPIKA